MDAKTLTHNLGGVWRHGRGQAPCPICQRERRRDQNALSISESGDKLLLHCFKSNCSFVEIAGAAGADLGRVQIDFEAQAQHERKQAEYHAERLRKARSLWEAARPIAGTKGEAYLRSRGITCELPDSLRFMPDIHHAPSMTWGSAIIADVEPTGGVHRTFLTKQGEKQSRDAKMMLGPCARGAVRLREGHKRLVVCEGIETGLSLLSGLLSGSASVWATLSTSGMKSLTLPETPSELIVATDGDEPGREAGDRLASRASALGWTACLMPAPDGKDFNDVLLEGVKV